MKYLILLFTLNTLFLPVAKAQNAGFISAGSIEFEQKINLYKVYKGNTAVLDILKKQGMQFRTSLFNLKFDSSQTVYQTSRATTENIVFQNLIPIGENGVYINLGNKTRLRKKQIHENTLFISDTLSKIRWKITDERRQIAGFDCKRANAIIMDSVYVVAFFTEEILVQGGPESFFGLPGMILGVALPQEHITWFANKVSVTENVQPVQPITKGKIISSNEFKDIVTQNFNPSDETDNWYFKFYLL